MKKITIELNLPYCSEAFKAAWETLVSMPKWRGKPGHSLQIALNRLGGFEEAFAIKLMEDAIIGNWQGVVFGGTENEYRKWLESRHVKVTGEVIRERMAEQWDQRLEIRQAEAVPMPEAVRKALLGK